MKKKRYLVLPELKKLEEQYRDSGQQRAEAVTSRIASLLIEGATLPTAQLHEVLILIEEQSLAPMSQCARVVSVSILVNQLYSAFCLAEMRREMKRIGSH